MFPHSGTKSALEVTVVQMAIGEKVPFGMESRHSLVNAEPRLQSIKRFFAGKRPRQD